MKKCCRCNEGEMLLFYRQSDNVAVYVCDNCGYAVEDEQATKDGANVICLACAGSGTSYNGNKDCVICNGMGYVKVK